MSLHNQAIGLFIFFPVLCTIALGLRLYVRTKLCKGAFGWDDVALIFTWAGMIVWVGMAWTSIQYGYGSDKWSLFVDSKNYVCYVISGVVKISVALVLYRLDTRRWMHILLISDMVTCALWTVVVSLIIGLGCTVHSPYTLSRSVCEASNYAQELSYVIFNGLHVIIPVFILWGVQIRDNLKWAVVALFSFGLLAVVAAIMKLRVYVEYYNQTPETDIVALWYQSMIWAITEHGLSLFAASILAIRPFFTLVHNTYGSPSSKLGYWSSSRRKSSSATGASRRVSKNSNGPGTPGSTQLGRIGVRNEFDMRSEYDLEDGLRQPSYKADAYGDRESARTLISGGSKARSEVKFDEVGH